MNSKVLASRSLRKMSFSTDDGNVSENVTLKINSRFFKLSCVYSCSLEMSNVGEFSGVEILATALKFKKISKKNSPSLVNVTS